MPLGLKACYTSKTRHGEKVEEDLGGVEDDGWFGDDHLSRRSQYL